MIRYGGVTSRSIVAGPSRNRLLWYNSVLQKGMVRYFSMGDSKSPFNRATNPLHRNQVLKLNAQFYSTLNNSSQKTIELIVSNLKGELEHDFVETFLWNHLSAANLPQMVQLMELLVEHQQFSPSNELWSMYLSLTHETCSLEGAKLIFHNVIDNYKFYDDNYSVYNQTQTSFPFPVSPTSLSQLALIFQRNQLPEYIVGIRDYFKRFYSMYGHRESLKSISISLVEAYASAGDIKNALWSFRYLCMMYREHQNFVSKKLFLERVYSMLNSESHKRLENIRSNSWTYPEWPEKYMSDVDHFQDFEIKQNGGQIYHPVNLKNSPARVVPTFNGHISVRDLPAFYDILNQAVLKIMQSQSMDRILKLVNLIRQNHFMLTNFVVSSLSQNGYLSEALLVMNKIKWKNLDKMYPIIFKDETFLILMKSCSRQLSSVNEVGALLNFHQFVDQVMNFYFKVKDKEKSGLVNPQIMSLYVQLVLESPSIRVTELESKLRYFMKRNPDDKIYLSDPDYQKFTQLYDIPNSRYKSLIRPQK